MPRIYINKAQPGMVLLEDVIDSHGNFLLEKGTVLDENKINRLMKLGVRRIFVEGKEESSPPVNCNENKTTYGLESLTYQESLANSEFILNDIAEKGEFTTENLALSKQVINHLVEDIMENRVVLENKENIYHLNNIIDNLVEQDVLMHDVEMIRNHDEYTFVHSVNVSAMAVIIGLAFDYDVNELKKLGLAALLHDIGKIKVDSALINKPGKLTAEEKLIMNKHSQYTYELLRERSEIDEAVALAAYQHHEKFDGTGYPQGLKGEEIVPFARIIAVADVYDALVTDRSYRKSMMSYVAAEIIQASCYTHFDPVVVKAFMQNIIIYPVGSMVELSTGEKGIVCRINPSMPARPVVIVAFRPSGNRYLPPKTIDLMKSLTVFIVKVYSSDN